MAKKDVFAPVDTDHSAFRSWFGKSVLHDNGVPRTYYHGTSKDADFKKFKMSRHGVWLTADPEEASKYAIENDSQGFRAEGWSIKPTNTASRVIPVHARIEKPFVGEMPQEYIRDNYKKSQSDWFDALRSNGYDGWVPKSQNGKLAVALGNAGQIKSALSNTGDYSETGDINKAAGGPVDDYIPHDDPRRAQNLKKFHGKTPDAIKNTRWYHGTGQDFQTFRRGKSGAIFVSPDPKFASFFATDPDREAPAANVMPVHVRAEKPFDYENAKHLNVLMQQLGPQLINDPQLRDTFDQVREGFWGAIEDRTIQKAIRSLGHDSFFVKERDESGEPSKNLAVYNPSQLKSATGNNGNFDLTADDITKAEGGSVDDQPQRDLSPLGLYSHAAEMASQLPQERGSPQQMAGMLVNKYGVKPVEMEGFDEAFAGQPIVTRDQLVQHFKSKMPQIEETILGGKKAPEMDHAAKRQWIERWAAKSAYESGDIENVRDWGEAPSDVLDWHRDIAQNKFNELMALDPDFADRFQSEGEGGKTKFQKYTLPGGENYREVLLKLPKRETTTGDIAQKLFGRNINELSLEEGRAVAEEMRRLGPSAQFDFTNSHWQDPNVLAHLRMSDRTGPNGEKILHVEEIQSDWAQKGRDEGFAKKLDPKILDQLGEEQSSAMFRLEDARDAFNSAYENIFRDDLRAAFKDAPTEYDLQNALKMHDEVIRSKHPQKRFDEYRSNFLRMPDSFTPEEHNLLQDAYDAYREKRDSYNSAKKKIFEYKLSSAGVPAGPYVTKTADWTDLALKRALKEAAEGGYDKLVWTPGEEQAKRYSLSTKVERIAYDPEEKVFSYVPKGRHDWVDHDKTVEPKDLPGIVGKEVAEKLLATEPSKLSGIHNLEAADLEVGGHGMKGYYDKIVPTQLQKLVKKLDPEARLNQYKLSESETPLHAIDITPKMRESIKRGLPAFASGGAVDEDEDEGITAYHGSPYDFSKFDISKIGTGEGNATYGHGLYFTEHEPIARQYRDDLSQGTYQSADGKVLDPYAHLEHLNVRVAAGKSLDNAIERARGLLETQPENADMINRDLAKLMEAKSNNASPRMGHMYEVRIKAHPDHFLDWDEVLEDQNDYIKSILPRIADRDEEQKGYSDLHDHLQEPDAYTGGAFYRSMAERGREKEASEILSQMGIKGIRYKDAGSRFKNGEPSYNYVVFNHDHVDIKRKYARGGAVEAG